MAAVLSGLECLALAFGTHILHGTVHLSRSAPMICTQILVPYQEMTIARAAGIVKHKPWVDSYSFLMPCPDPAIKSHVSHMYIVS